MLTLGTGPTGVATMAGTSSVRRSSSSIIEWCKPSPWAISLPLTTRPPVEQLLLVESPRQLHPQGLVVLPEAST